ncbi:MAG: UvrD-helicase domain-containing protein [Planctomycetota bacterium]
MSFDFTDQLLEPLNPAQREAVQHVDGPLLILAGPGSGKTRVITHRIAYLIGKGIPSHHIAALTFTNKAADEMKARLKELEPHNRTWTGTFHRFCSRILRIHAEAAGLEPNFTIYDSGDSKKVVKQAIQNTEVDIKHYSPASLQNHISNVKNKGVTAEKYAPMPGVALDAILARVYPEYQKLLRMANGVDFDDLLLHCVELFRENNELRQAFDERYSYFMVDEYQDTNFAQYQLIRLLNFNVRNIAVTGDPDQSIYGWRGADIRNILQFEQDYDNVKVVRLEQNYRSTKAILSVADQLIENNLQRKHKSLKTDNEDGKPVRLVAFPMPQDEATDIADTISLAIEKGKRRPRDFAVFYRANWLSRSVEHALTTAGVPYQVVNGHEFYQRREIKDIVAYLHLLNNPRDNVAFERIVNVPRRKIGAVTISRLRDHALAAGISMLESARNAADVSTLSAAPAKKLRDFAAMIDGLSMIAHDPTVSFVQVGTIIKSILDATEYREWLTADGSEEAFERAGNIDELVNAAQEFDNEHPDDGGLERYLEQCALVSDTDVWESTSDFVSLMTIHASKGLEFPHVFIVGAEDGVLPHERSNESDEEIEEERRLFFVGITRAMEQLQISRSMSRMKKGSFWPTIASRFLMELPRETMEVYEPQSHQPPPEFFDDMGWGDGPGAYPDESDSFSSEEPEEADVSFDIDLFEKEAADIINRGRNDDDVDSVKEKAVTLAAAKKSGKPERSKLPRIMTAAQLAEKQENLERVPPSSFRVGQTVEHLEYGTGKVVMVSGRDNRRTAAVEFAEHGRKSFRLAFCNLQIVDTD